MTINDIHLLEGVALDEAVAKTLGIEPGAAYSTDWSHGGPLIEGVGIELSISCFISESDKKPLSWSARVEVSLNDGDDWKSAWGNGPTALIAAMRAYVASTHDEAGGLRVRNCVLVNSRSGATRIT